ncbi:uncharacterized protein LOC122365754 [Amphibalanus amphitrite]|uniref:uncharacterized protein LOC122365754 n=1 Tax=Amphibalanus amphitrite TaxID=1232801 RepID=UPI001C919C73|nr:uncharacterized protein LOC122365754 [Amphibalanus amphitrite]
MGLPSVSVGAIVAALLLVSGAAASMFVTDQIQPTFSLLKSRGCLPDDFNNSASKPAAPNCMNLVSDGDLPKTCEGVPRLSLFYVCYAKSQGMLGDTPTPPTGDKLEEAIAFLLAQMKGRKSKYTSDAGWIIKAYQIMDECAAQRAAGLSLPRAAVYSLTLHCLRWSWFVDCDRQQEERGELDAAGARRRAAFLCGQCPLSPASLRAVLESATSRTLQQCDTGDPAEEDPHQRYADGVAKVISLLEDFQSGNKLKYDELQSAVTNELSGANSEMAEKLMKVLFLCESTKTSEDFVKAGRRSACSAAFIRRPTRWLPRFLISVNCPPEQGTV